MPRRFEDAAPESASEANEPPAQIKEPEAQPAPEAPPPSPPSFVVAPGHTIHCRRGVLGDGDVVEARFVGGDEALAKLVTDGAVLPAP